MKIMHYRNQDSDISVYNLSLLRAMEIAVTL